MVVEDVRTALYLSLLSLTAVCPATGQSGYAGSRTCAGCHTGIYKRQQSGNHAHSLRPPGEIEQLTRQLPFQYLDRPSQAHLTISQGADGQLRLEAIKESEHAVLLLRWAFGSGDKGITMVGLDASGKFIEGRLSWYAAEGTYSLTTGATRSNPQTALESLGRTLTSKQAQECFSCHTTAYTAGQSGPAVPEMGIHCERCHGPGLEHSLLTAGPNAPARGQDRKISNPGRLDAFAQVEMCGACHGRPPRDTDLAAIQFIERTPDTARFPSQRLVLSHCYNESAEGIKCTTCHDPHSNLAAQRSQRDRACIGCHTDQVRPKARVCPTATSNCVSCHMPKQRVMLHSEFTDHWIRTTAAKAPGGLH
jgi:predicted CXXCH cytochrome family protein